MSKALLFIPDIGGFTEFITKTELKHSRHLIKELLNIFIVSNQLNLKISEIEGDAVLFYRFGLPPPLNEVVEQCKTLFIKFHRQLKRYERDRVCQCSACLANLSLKVIVHYGEVSHMEVDAYDKLIGAPVIVVHRLLKNNLQEKEYVLLTEDYLSSLKSTEIDKANDWTIMKRESIEYPQIGKVDYQYFLLSPLHEQVSIPYRPNPKKYKNPIKSKVKINAPPMKVHDIITNQNVRCLVNQNPKELEYDQDYIPRVGSQYECNVPDGNLTIEAIESVIEKTRIVYGEQIKNMPNLDAPVNTFFILMSDNQDTTELTYEVHYEPASLREKKMILQHSKKIIQAIKDYVEEHAHE